MLLVDKKLHNLREWIDPKFIVISMIKLVIIIYTI